MRIVEEHICIISVKTERSPHEYIEAKRSVLRVWQATDNIPGCHPELHVTCIVDYRINEDERTKEEMNKTARFK